MSEPRARLRFLFPAWFALVMGLSGLALAWRRAAALLGDAAAAVGVVLALIASRVFTALALATLLRVIHHPDAWREDVRHPLRHPFTAAIPMSAVLLALLALASIVIAGFVLATPRDLGRGELPAPEPVAAIQGLPA